MVSGRSKALRSSRGSSRSRGGLRRGSRLFQRVFTLPGVGSTEMVTGSVPRTESWPLCRSAQADSMSLGRCGRRLRDASPSSTSSGAVPLAAGRSRTSKRRPSEADCARGAIVCRCARGRVGWQKLSGGVGLRRSLLVAAKSETWGLAPSGKPQRAKGRRESALGA